MENETTEILETETSETVSSGDLIVECIDYTEQFDTLTTQLEYLTYTNQQILTTNLFSISLVVGVGISFILYKIFKIFF